jgi:hypothetical protein
MIIYNIYFKRLIIHMLLICRTNYWKIGCLTITKFYAECSSRLYITIYSWIIYIIIIDSVLGLITCWLGYLTNCKYSVCRRVNLFIAIKHFYLWLIKIIICNIYLWCIELLTFYKPSCWWITLCFAFLNILRNPL